MIPVTTVRRVRSRSGHQQIRQGRGTCRLVRHFTSAVRGVCSDRVKKLQTGPVASAGPPPTIDSQMKLGHLMVFVTDLEAARAFYVRVLGFSVDRESENHAVFRFEGGELAAFKCDRDAQIGDYSREARAVFVFDVPAIEETMITLKAQGIKLLHDLPAEGPLGRYAAFVDPFGIVHEIRELPAG
jgi:glyoxylase I family protein